MRNLTVFIFLSVAFQMLYFGQDAANLVSSNGYIGYSIYTPQFRFKEEVQRVDSWLGFEMAVNNLLFSVHNGTIRPIEADSTMSNVSGKIFNVGYRLGANLNLGKNSFTSAGIKPFVQFNFPVSQITNRVTDNTTSSIGMGVSPGITVKFSHLYLIARYDANFNLNSIWFGDNGRFNAAKGYIGGVNLTVGLDNAFDFLSPRIFKMKGMNLDIKKRTYDKGIHFDRYRQQWYQEYLTVTTTTRTPGEKVSSMNDPFWGIGPSYSFNSLVKNQAPSSMIGLNIGARRGYFMIDAFYEQGKQGLENQVEKEDILTTFPRLRDFDFSSKINATRYGGRIGFNLSKMLQFSNFETSKHNMTTLKSMIPFMRFSGYFTAGKMIFSGTPEYTYSNGRELLKEYQSFNNITSNANNNPDYLKGESIYTGWGINLEFGSAFINKTWYKYQNASIANSSILTVGTNIPIGRLFRHINTKRIINKKLKNSK